MPATFTPTATVIDAEFTEVPKINWGGVTEAKILEEFGPARSAALFQAPADDRELQLEWEAMTPAQQALWSALAAFMVDIVTRKMGEKFDEQAAQQAALHQQQAAAPPTPAKKKMGAAPFIVGGVVLAAGAGGAWWWFWGRKRA